MKIGPKYKIARKLGAPIFEKTQTQKFALRAEKKSKSKGFGKPKSEYGQQHNEKQKAKMYYGVSEKQFSKYVKESLEKKGSSPVNNLFERLETRLDNIVTRIGLAPSHRAGRQMVSHGHILINGIKVKVPSRKINIGDKISIREGSKESKIFSNFEEKFKDITIPSWISFDIKTKTAVSTGLPQVKDTNLMFDLNAVIEFYSR
jgi:small subunit ribosomal protein S4